MDKSIVPINKIAARSSTGYEFSNPNGAVVVEIEDDENSVTTVEKQMEDLKLNYQFDEKNVSQFFQFLFKVKTSSLKKIRFHIYNQFCTMKFNEIEIHLERSENGLSINYEHGKETLGCDDPEKSIVDHLWFVLRNPGPKLEELGFYSCKDPKTEFRRKLDPEKLITLLQSMIDSIDRQIQTDLLDCQGFDEDTFLSMLKHVEPGILGDVSFFISWKEEGNYEKMEEIVETDQWKQARTISSHRVTPLKIDDLFHCERFGMELTSVTPEDVLRVVEHAFNSSCRKNCKLSCEHKKYDINAIIDFLRSQNDGSRIIKFETTDPTFKFVYKIMKSDKHVFLSEGENYIYITTD